LTLNQYIADLIDQWSQPSLGDFYDSLDKDQEINFGKEDMLFIACPLFRLYAL